MSTMVDIIVGIGGIVVLGIAIGVTLYFCKCCNNNSDGKSSSGRSRKKKKDKEKEKSSKSKKEKKKTSTKDKSSSSKSKSNKNSKYSDNDLENPQNMETSSLMDDNYRDVTEAQDQRGTKLFVDEEAQEFRAHSTDYDSQTSGGDIDRSQSTVITKEQELYDSFKSVLTDGVKMILHRSGKQAKSVNIWLQDSQLCWQFSSGFKKKVGNIMIASIVDICETKFSEAKLTTSVSDLSNDEVEELFFTIKYEVSDASGSRDKSTTDDYLLIKEESDAVHFQCSSKVERDAMISGFKLLHTRLTTSL